MSNYIAVDGGTTNTRISLCTDGKVIETLSFRVGAKKSIGNKEILKETVRNGIREILDKNGYKEGDVKAVLACGMLTSELGLLELPHTVAPAGMEELHGSMHLCRMEDIAGIPFAFMRGVKTECTTVENSDMMRGEETELMGVFSGDGVYVFPGSHTKIIETENGKIRDSRTMLTGEMIYAVATDTILADAVKLEDHEICKETLLQGFDYADKHGIGEALFKVRILKNTFHKSESELYSFFLGVMVSGEIRCILSRSPKRVVIGGKAAIKEAIGTILKEYTDAEIVILSNEEVDHSTVNGMIRIYEYRT
ncbi:MAG: 2-dehydro-3-deoxygalactonokinase [Clostridia bacterium]|nr:2-dehydro-3-deoxygalactonokinase [Clostridia bacterium]